MNKRYLPVIAAIMIAVTCTAFLPAFAQLPTYVYSAPTLSITTIPQGDQDRNTGVVWFSNTEANYQAGLAGVPDMIGTGVPSLLTQFKVLVSYNGVPVVPTSWSCQVLEKDKVNPIKNRQFTQENLYTQMVDMSSSWICKFRFATVGVYVLDLYYVGPGTPVAIADYVLVVDATYAVGRSTVYGTDLQDVCAIGWPVPTTPAYIITKPDGTLHYIYADVLTGYSSCGTLALQEQNELGVPIAWS